jgi:hypothetical protein
MAASKEQGPMSKQTGLAALASIIRGETSNPSDQFTCAKHRRSGVASTIYNRSIGLGKFSPSSLFNATLSGATSNPFNGAGASGSKARGIEGRGRATLKRKEARDG